MGAVRRRLADHLPTRDLHGRFFVVRHADEAVCATATADTEDDLQVLVRALRAAGRELADDGVLGDVPVESDADQLSVAVMLRSS